MTNEERRDFYMNRNIKLYPIYLSMTWDLLFVWTIMNMFLNQVKGISYSSVVMLSSIQMIAACIMCIPITKRFAKTPPVLASRLGNLGYIVCLLLIMFGINYFTFALAYIALAYAYVMCSVKHVSILNESLSRVDRDKEYDRVYGSGVSIYYVFEALSAIIASYLYSWKPISVFWISLAIVVVAEIYSFLFKEPTKFPAKNVDLEPVQATTNEKKVTQPDKFLKILSSSFVIMLLLYAFITRGVLNIDTTIFKLYLQQLTEPGGVGGIVMPMWLYGYVFAIMRLGTALSSKYQFKFNLKFGVRSLIIFMFVFFATTVSSALVYLFMPDTIVKVVLLIVIMIIGCFIRSPNQIFISNYMQVCTQKKNFERMYALKTIAEYLGYAIFNALYAQLLGVFNNNWGWANLVYIAIAVIPIVALLILFIKALTKKFAQKYTIIKPEYTEDFE